MKKYYAIILLMVISMTAAAQVPVLDWADQISVNGTGNSSDMITDANGNVYVVGTVESLTDFDPGPGVYNNYWYSGASTIYIQKLDVNGNMLWTRFMETDGACSAESIALDMNGNIYVTGGFSNSLAMYNGPVPYGVSPVGDRDVFVLKLDSGANILWLESMGGSQYEEGVDIAVDSLENVYITGFFEGTADFDPDYNDILELTSNGGVDIFIEKLDINGDLVWVKQIGGGLWDLGTSISVSPAGDVYCVGEHRDTVDLDPGLGIHMSIASGQSVVYLEKLTTDGDFVWAKTINGIGVNDYTISASCAIDASENIYLAGKMSGTVDLDPNAGTFLLSNQNTFIEKIDQNGTFLWGNSIQGSLGVEEIKIDSQGASYLTGSFIGTIQIDPSGSNFSMTSSAGSDIHVQKFNPNGSFGWAINMGGTGYDWASAIALDNNNNILVTGTFNQTADLDPGAATLSFTSAVGNDIFVLKLDNCTPVITSMTVESCLFYSLPSGSAIYNISGNYTDTLTNACGADSILIIDLTINTVDVAVTNVDPLLTATASGAIYQWIDCGNGNAVISSATNATYTPTQNGEYAVIVTQNGCSDTSSCYTVESVSLNEWSFGDAISLYPNPTNQNITIDLGKIYAEVDLQIMNSLGQIISRKVVELTDSLEIDLVGANGVYYIVVQTEEGKVIRKVTKE